MGTEFRAFLWRAIVCHTSTYMVVGIVASLVFDYELRFEGPFLNHMRPIDSVWVAAGLGGQVLRGAIFAVALFPVRQSLLHSQRGYLKLWALLLGIGILSPFGPSPGSFEGLMYTRLPLHIHLLAIPEVWLQSFVFSVCFVGWYRRPHRAWSRTLVPLFVLSLVFSVAGVLQALFAPEDTGTKEQQTSILSAASPTQQASIHIFDILPATTFASLSTESLRSFENEKLKTLLN